jgi:hypothetical protein
MIARRAQIDVRPGATMPLFAGRADAHRINYGAVADGIGESVCPGVGGRQMSVGERSSRIIALAGRRIDAHGLDPPAFPLANVGKVRSRLAEAFQRLSAVGLVCSGACGADLVALDAAAQLGLRRRIVLPFAPAQFRRSSVVDRPGDWGSAFDRQIDAAAQSGELVVLDLERDACGAYVAANKAIIREALAVAGAAEQARCMALLVWEGARRPGGDATADFGDLATEAGLEQITIPTL